MLTAGTLIDGKYEVERVLGAGGFGTVYGAVQPQLGRTVAVKVVSTTLLHEADGLARFEREAKAISSLNHKNIVQFYGYGTWQQAPYMVMELVAGTSLEEILRGGRSIEPMRALRLIHQLFEALGAAHEVGVIHRDLKPSNILVQNSELGETLKIIDFGLAKLMPGYGIPGQKLTETGYALGTCAYMPPQAVSFTRC
jgi:eukaryotic-like serine/threonine-protein kinase